MVEEHIIVLTVKNKGDIMLEYAYNLLENDKEDIFINNFIKIMDECHIYILMNPKFTNVVIKYNLFFSNIKYFAKKYKYTTLLSYIDYFYSCDKSYVEENIFSMLECSKSEIDYIKLIKFCKDKNIDINYLYKYIEKNNLLLEDNRLLSVLLFNYKDITINNIDCIINHSIKLLDLKYMLNQYEVSNDKIDLINKKIRNNKNLVSEEILSTAVGTKDLKDDIIKESISIIIDELKNNENINYEDICILSKNGAYSVVYQIGDKVFKIGRRREVFVKRNNKRFLQPLYREEILDKDNVDYLFCVEITEVVDTKNITKEDVYFIYKELRDCGLVWTDCKEENIGRLLKDNKIYFKGIDKVDKSAVGYNNDNEEMLKEGDLVIIDNDYIYDEEEYFKNNYLAPSEYFYEFEQRYRAEHNNVK